MTARMAERRAREAEEPAASPAPTPALVPVPPPAAIASPAAAPAEAPAPPSPWQSYKEVVAQLAGRIVEAQRPIRVLQALRWDDSVEEQFFKTKARELPKVDVATYDREG